MYTATITNPKTKRTNRVKVWEICAKDAVKTINQHGAKVLGIKILDQTIEMMESERKSIESMENFAMNAFENALDWGLGIAVTNYLIAFQRQYPGKRPKVVRVCANRNGDCFILSKEQKVIM